MDCVPQLLFMRLCSPAAMFCGTAKAPGVWRKAISLLRLGKVGYESGCWMCSSGDQLLKPDCCLRLSFHVINNNRGQPKAWILCVARVKTRQVGQICSKSHHEGHLEQGLWEERGARTQPAYRGPRVSQPAGGLTLTSVFTKSNARKRKQVTGRKAWGGGVNKGRELKT